jgi:hypothetical protein
MSDEIPPIGPVLATYGAEDLPDADYGHFRKMLCPFHDDSRPSAMTDGYGFKCLAEDLFYPNAFVLVVEREGVTFDEARSRVAEIVGASDGGVRAKPRPGTFIPERSRVHSRDRSFLPPRRGRRAGA